MVGVNQQGAQLLIKEATRETPFVQISYDGNIHITGNATGLNIDKFFLSLFWGINKLTSQKLIITIDLNKYSVAAIRNIFILLRIISKHPHINDATVIWFSAGPFEKEIGETYSELLPEFNFLYYNWIS